MGVQGDPVPHAGIVAKEPMLLRQNPVAGIGGQRSLYLRSLTLPRHQESIEFIEPGPRWTEPAVTCKPARFQPLSIW
jgi:hypothetical protein